MLFNSNNNNDPREYYLKKFGYLHMWTKDNVQEYLNSDGDYRGIASKFPLDGLKLAEMTEPQFISYAESKLGINLFNSLQYFKEKNDLERENKRIKVRAMDADPEWSNPQPIEIPDFTQQIVKISHLIASGLGKVDHNYFFVRNEWKTLLKTISAEWKSLGEEPTIRCHLFGPPGTGKSSMIWAWCCELSKEKNIRWLKFLSEGEGGIQEAFLNGSTVSHRFWSDALAFPWRSLAGDLIVIDAYTKNTRVAVPQNTPVLYVSSMQIHFNSESMQLRRPMILWSLGWTLDEVLTACNGNDLFNSVKSKLDAPLLQYMAGEDKEDEESEQNSERTKLLEEKKKKFAPNRTHSEIQQILAKHYFAGGSARWMFTFRTKELKDSILLAIKKVNNWEEFASGLVGSTSSHTAVNTLCTTVPPLPDEHVPQSIFVSEFVTEKLSDYATLLFKRANH